MADTAEEALTVITNTTGTAYVRMVDNTAGIPVSAIMTPANFAGLAAVAEVIQDNIGGIMSGTSGITVTYNDGANTISVAISDAELLAIAGLTSAADKLPYFTGAGTASLADFSAFARTLLDDAAAVNARTTLGVVIGTDVQAQNAILQDIAGLTQATDTLPYFDSATTAATTPLTAFARTILDDANQAAVQTTLGLVPGTNVQAYDADLAAIAGLVSAADKGIQFTGAGTAGLFDLTTAGKALLDDAAASNQRTTLGLGTIATQDSATVSISGGSITGITDLAVADGGTGASTAANARTNLGLVIGTDVQAQNAILADLAGLIQAANKGIYFDTATTAATFDLTAAGLALLDDAAASNQRTTLGLGTMATETAANYLLKVAAGAAVENLGAVEYNTNTVATTGATETLDTSVYSVHDCTMDQACTFTFSNPAPSGKLSCFVLILRGAFTPTFPASVDWGDAAAPTYTTPSVYSFITVDAGTTWLGWSAGKAFA